MTTLTGLRRTPNGKRQAREYGKLLGAALREQIADPERRLSEFRGYDTFGRRDPDIAAQQNALNLNDFAVWSTYFDAALAAMHVDLNGHPTD